MVERELDDGKNWIDSKNILGKPGNKLSLVVVKEKRYKGKKGIRYAPTWKTAS